MLLVAKDPPASFRKADIDLALYSRYFEHQQHPSTDQTLLHAATEAGILESNAKRVFEGRSEGLQDVKMLLREQTGNGVDNVPYIVVEGKRRDLTLIGTKEVEEYEKVLAIVVRESR